MSPAARRTWLHLARAVVLITLLGWAFSRVRLSQMAGVLGGARPAPLVLAAALYAISVLLQGLRLWVLLRADGANCPLPRVQYVSFAAAFFDLFTPGRVGSDVCRLLSLRSHVDPHRLAVVLLIFRVQLLWVALVVTALAVWALGWPGWIGVASSALAAGGVLSGFAARRGLGAVSGWLGHAAGPWLRRIGIDRLLEALAGWSWGRAGVGTSSLLAAAYILVNAVLFAAVGHALGMRLGLGAYLAGVPILLVAASLPVSIHGRGLTEVTALALWSGPGATPEQVLWTTLLTYVLVVLHSLLAGVCWLIVPGPGALCRPGGPAPAVKPEPPDKPLNPAGEPARDVADPA